MSVFTVQDIRMYMYVYITCNMELSFNVQFSFLRPKVSFQCPLFTFLCTLGSIYTVVTLVLVGPSRFLKQIT